MLADGLVADDGRRELFYASFIDLAVETGDAAAAERWIHSLLAVSAVPPAIQLESLRAAADLEQLVPAATWAALAAEAE